MSKKKTTVDGDLIWKDAERISGTSREDDACVAVALLIASAIVGPSVKRCAKLLDVKWPRINWMVRNLTKNKVWHRGKVAGAEWMGENGGAALNLDACVALGLLERA